MHVIRIFAIVSALSLTLSALGQGKTTTEEYIEKYKAIAVSHMEKFGIPASITMAQGILESNSGNSPLSIQSNNHFGIKCKSNWKGRRVYHDDDAKGECFRAYPTVEESYLDHAQFLDSSPRYDSLFRYPADDYRSWARGLKAAGYATAPDYTERLIRIIEKYRLYLLDHGLAGDYNAFSAVMGTSKVETVSTEPSPSQATPVQPHHHANGHGVNPDEYQVSTITYCGHSVYSINHVYHVYAKDSDTYASVGRTFRISEKNLRKFNDAAKDAVLGDGDIVFLGLKKMEWEGSAVTHTVRKDETLYSISQSYGIQLRSLRRMNGLKKSSTVVEGDQIIIRR